LTCFTVLALWTIKFQNILLTDVIQSISIIHPLRKNQNPQKPLSVPILHTSCHALMSSFSYQPSSRKLFPRNTDWCHSEKKYFFGFLHPNN